MTRKHYKAIVAAISGRYAVAATLQSKQARAAANAVLDATTAALAIALLDTNPLFSPLKFMSACKVNRSE